MVSEIAKQVLDRFEKILEPKSRFVGRRPKKRARGGTYNLVCASENAFFKPRHKVTLSACTCKRFVSISVCHAIIHTCNCDKNVYIKAADRR